MYEIWYEAAQGYCQKVALETKIKATNVWISVIWLYKTKLYVEKTCISFK